MKSLIAKLVKTAGPPGFENEVRSLARSEIEPFVEELRVDSLGNLIARKGQLAPGGLKVMLAAHLDEVGLIVSHIDEKGFARFTPLGPLNQQSAVGSRVRFFNGVTGLIGLEMPPGGIKASKFDEMFIDLGVKGRRQCPVRIGDPAVFEGELSDLGERMVGKALDDRVGIALLIEVARRMSEQKIESPNEIYFVFSAQEEIGSRGAAAAAFSIDPDLGLSLHLSQAGGTPNGPHIELELGRGPGIKVKDQWMLSDPRVVDWLVRTAKEAHIPYQMEIVEKGTTDACAIQLSRTGVPAASLSLPARYLHSPTEMADYDDAQNMLDLLLALLCKPIELEK